MSKHRPDLGTHGLPRARARRGPHRPCPRVTDPASRPSRPSGACGRPARGAPRAACRAARGIVASAGGVPARPPAPGPAPAAPAGSGCAALRLLLLDGSPLVLVDGSAAWSREGRRRPQLRRRRSAGSDRVSGVEGGGAKRVWRIHRHEPRGRGRGTPGGGSRGRLYGARHRVRSPAAAPLPPSLRRL